MLKFRQFLNDICPTFGDTITGHKTAPPNSEQTFFFMMQEASLSQKAS